MPSTKARLKVCLSANSVHEKNITKDVGNLTFFNCSLCTKTNISYGCLVKHKMRNHQIKNYTYDKNEVQDAQYHKCLICSRLLLCDNTIVAQHISTYHRTSFLKYKEEYVLKVGGKIFPSLIEYRRNNCVFNIVGDSFSSPDLDREKDENSLIQPSMLSSESEESDLE